MALDHEHAGFALEETAYGVGARGAKIVGICDETNELKAVLLCLVENVGQAQSGTAVREDLGSANKP